MNFVLPTALGILVAASAPASAQEEGDNQGTLAIVGGAIVDPGGVSINAPTVILIEHQRIVTVGSPDDVTIPDGAHRIDAAGRTIIPGLFDLHFHCGFSRTPDDDDPHPEMTAALEWGVTSILDPGTDQILYDPLAAAVAERPLFFPNHFVALGMYTAPNGYGTVKMPHFAPETEAVARAIVREQKQAGFDWIKVAYEDLLWFSTRAMPVMEAEILHVLVDEAHRRKMKVIVQAPQLELAKEVLRAGADCLAHGIIDEPVDEEFFELMDESGACYMSTSSVSLSFGGLGGWVEHLEAADVTGRLDEQIGLLRETVDRAPARPPRGSKLPLQPETLAILNDNLSAIAEAELPIVIGTDTAMAGILPGLAVHAELALHVAAGLTPEETLVAATTRPAGLLGRGADLGSVAVGHVADLLILDADPRDDIRNTARIHTVVRGGRIVER